MLIWMRLPACILWANISLKLGDIFPQGWFLIIPNIANTLRSNLPRYDIVLGLTGLDLTRRIDGGSSWNHNTAGYSYVGGACTRNSVLKKVSSVALIEDSGAYSGVIVTAHEIGHLLGASHDGDVAPRYLGGPGGQKCPCGQRSPK